MAGQWRNYTGGPRDVHETLCFMFPDGTAYLGQTLTRERYEKAICRRFRPYGVPEIFELGSFAPDTPSIDEHLTAWRYRMTRQGIALRRYDSPASTYLVDVADIPNHVRHKGDRAILPAALCDRAEALLSRPRPDLLVFCAVFPPRICAFGITLVRPDEDFSLRHRFTPMGGSRNSIADLPYEMFTIARYAQMPCGNYPYLAAEQSLSAWRKAFRTISGRPADLDRWDLVDACGSFKEPDHAFLNALPEPLFEAITYAVENWRDTPALFDLDGEDTAPSYRGPEADDDSLHTVLHAIERNTRDIKLYLSATSAGHRPGPSTRIIVRSPLLRSVLTLFGRRT